MLLKYLVALSHHKPHPKPPTATLFRLYLVLLQKTFSKKQTNTKKNLPLHPKKQPNVIANKVVRRFGIELFS